MYYYIKDEDIIKKYEILYDVDDLKRKEKDLIRDCHTEVSRSYTTYGLPHRDKGVLYKKFDYKLIGVNSGYYCDFEIYQVDTIKIVEPYLCEVINKIIYGSISSLEELYNYKIENVDEDKKNLDYYVYLFQNSFKADLVATLDIETYNEVCEFLGYNIINNKSFKLVRNISKS